MYVCMWVCARARVCVCILAVYNNPYTPATMDKRGNIIFYKYDKSLCLSYRLDSYNISFNMRVHSVMYKLFQETRIFIHLITLLDPKCLPILKDCFRFILVNHLRV